MPEQVEHEADEGEGCAEGFEAPDLGGGVDEVVVVRPELLLLLLLRLLRRRE